MALRQENREIRETRSGYVLIPPEKIEQQASAITEMVLKCAKVNLRPFQRDYQNEVSEAAYVISGVNRSEGAPLISAMKRRKGIAVAYNPQVAAMIMIHHGRNNDRYFGFGNSREQRKMFSKIPDGEYGELTQPYIPVVTNIRAVSRSELGQMLGPKWELVRSPEIMYHTVLTRQDFRPTTKQLPDGYKMPERSLDDTDIDRITDLMKGSYHDNFFKPEALEEWKMHKGIFRVDIKKKKAKMVTIAGVYDIVPLAKGGTLVIASDVVTERPQSSGLLSFENHRNKGLAEIAYSAVLQNVFEQVPDAIIVADCNKISKHMSENLGFTTVSANYWASFGKKGRPRPLRFRE